MSYSTECSGTSSVDKSNSVSSGLTVLLPMNAILAQKFTPTSMCLQSVTVKLNQIYVGITGVTIYITPDSSGIPDNINWLTNSYEKSSKTAGQISTVATEYNFPLNIKLPNLNPVWIVVVPDIYDSTYTDGYSYVDIPIGDVTGSTTALKWGTSNWSLRAGETMIYKTYKTLLATSSLVLTQDVNNIYAAAQSSDLRRIVGYNPSNVEFYRASTLKTGSWTDTISKSGLVSGTYYFFLYNASDVANASASIVVSVTCPTLNTNLTIT